MLAPFLDQRKTFIFVATVRVFLPDFFDYPVQVDGYGRRGTLQHLKPFRFRRFRRAHMPLHSTACAHCIPMQIWPCTPPRAPYFRISQRNLVPMDRIGSIGHRHVEISTNFIHFRPRYRLQPQPICMLCWTVHLLHISYLSTLAPPATSAAPSPILRRVTPQGCIPASPAETPTISSHFPTSRGCEHQPFHQTIQSFNLTYTTLCRRHATPITPVGVMDVGHIGLIPLISKEIPPPFLLRL
jgi:hypothetical protein